MERKKIVEKEPSKEPALSYITEGATMECNCGATPVKLQIIDPKRTRIEGKRQGTVMDNRPMVNIPSFGACKRRKGPCTPVISMKWVNGKADAQIHGVAALTEKSQIACMTGGVIRIKDNGFTPKEPSRAEAGMENMANGGMMMMIGLGAVAVGLAALAVITAPVSLPVMAVAASTGLAMSTVATIGTVAAVGTVAAGGVTAAMGASDVAEGGQDVAGTSWKAVNPIRDGLFGGNDAAYGTAEMIASNVAMVGAIMLEPFATMGVKTSASKLKGKKVNAVEAAKRENAKARRYQYRRRYQKTARRYTKSNHCLRDPVDAIIGEVILDREDFALPGRIPLQWNRHYGSQSQYMGVCGRGWESPGDVRLVFDKDGTVLFHDGSGAPSFFNSLPDQTPVLEPVDGRRLLEEDGYYIVRCQGGLAYYFPVPKNPVEQIRLERLEDPFGNRVQYIWDASGLSEIRESSGRRIKVISKQGRIESLSLCYPDQSAKIFDIGCLRLGNSFILAY